MIEILTKASDVSAFHKDMLSSIFSDVTDKMRYHFLRVASDLNKLENPEWLLKYICDQIDTIRKKGVDSLVSHYIKAISRVVHERYKSD